MIDIDPFSEMSGNLFGYDRHSVWFNSYIWITLQVPCHTEPVQTWQEFWKKVLGKDCCLTEVLIQYTASYITL